MDEQTLTSVAQANALVLANAAAVGSAVIARIAGNEISNSLQGESATKERLTFLILGLMTKNLSSRVITKI